MQTPHASSAHLSFAQGVERFVETSFETGQAEESARLSITLFVEPLEFRDADESLVGWIFFGANEREEDFAEARYPFDVEIGKAP